MPEILAVVPVKGKSIDMPGKNVRMLGGQPAFTHAIAHALSSELVTRVIVSTDSAEIADIARCYDAEVPFIRPSELCKPEVMYPPVIAHVLEMLRADKYIPDWVVPLSGMHPFRRDALIDRVVSVALRHPGLDSVITAEPSFCNSWIDTDNGFKCLTAHIPQGSRQFRQPIYREIYGLVSVFKPSVIIAEKQFGERVRLYPVEDKVSLIDIDTPYDFWLAERIFQIYNTPDTCYETIC